MTNTGAAVIYGDVIQNIRQLVAESRPWDSPLRGGLVMTRKSSSMLTFDTAKARRETVHQYVAHRCPTSASMAPRSSMNASARHRLVGADRWSRRRRPPTGTVIYGIYGDGKGGNC